MVFLSPAASRGKGCEGRGDLARAAMRQEEIVLEERIGPEILPSESVGPGDCEPGIPYGVGR